MHAQLLHVAAESHNEELIRRADSARIVTADRRARRSRRAHLIPRPRLIGARAVRPALPRA